MHNTEKGNCFRWLETAVGHGDGTFGNRQLVPKNVSTPPTNNNRQHRHPHSNRISRDDVAVAHGCIHERVVVLPEAEYVIDTFPTTVTRSRTLSLPCKKIAANITHRKTSSTLCLSLLDHAHGNRAPLVFGRSACSCTSIDECIGQALAIVDTDRVQSLQICFGLIEAHQVAAQLSPRYTKYFLISQPS